MSLAGRALFAFEPETAHRMSIRALSAGIVPACPVPRDPRLNVRIAGLDFPNPVGLAAGYDKDAEVPDAILRLGFGFAEIGSVTPRAQPGNPRPRIFRLASQDAVINRLGFNNGGHASAHARLAARNGGGIVGVNIGANKDTEDFGADYETGLAAFRDVASYFTVNISSPNTPGLRGLQSGPALANLLARIGEKRMELSASGTPDRPIFLKIAPDLDESAMDDIARAVTNAAGAIDGLIVSNTTLARHGLRAEKHSGEAGGLSGRPLFERSTIALARMRQRVGELPIIGVGGVDGPETATAKLEAGANLVQLYTGMIYRGPWIAVGINAGIVALLDREGLSSVGALSGRKTADWAARKLPEER